MLSKQNLMYCGGLSLLWILAVIFVNPIGEFPLNDDGLYSFTVQSLVEDSTYDFNQTYAANLICQVYGCYLVGYCFFKLFAKREASRPFRIYFSLILFNIIYLGALFRYNFFDRYLLITFFTVSLLLLSELKINRKMDKIFISLTLIASTIFAILGTKDYMNWNRAVLQARTSLSAKQIPFENIESGLAFNQFFKDDPYDNNEEYMITMGLVDGYAKQDSFEFHRNLWLQKGHIFILKKQ